MPTTTEHLQSFSRADLIRTIQVLEGDLAVAAKGLMSVQSRSELEWELRKKDARLARIPKFIKWWFNI